MSQFTLEWDNERVLANPNAIGQRASYRLKSVGGDFTTSGFTPSNDLSIDAVSVDSPVGLPDNQILEFKIEGLCTAGGPSMNDNGLQEGINFACIVPALTRTTTTGTITMSLVGTDITKVRFTLKKASDNTIIQQTVVNRVTDAAGLTVNSLIPSTNYYWQTELFSNVNNTEVLSSDITQMGVPCSPYPFATNALPVCNPTTAGVIASIEVL